MLVQSGRDKERKLQWTGIPSRLLARWAFRRPVDSQFFICLPYKLFIWTGLINSKFWMATFQILAKSLIPAREIVIVQLLSRLVKLRLCLFQAKPILVSLAKRYSLDGMLVHSPLQGSPQHCIHCAHINIFAERGTVRIIKVSCPRTKRKLWPQPGLEPQNTQSRLQCTKN